MRDSEFHKKFLRTAMAQGEEKKLNGVLQEVGTQATDGKNEWRRESDGDCIGAVARCSFGDSRLNGIWKLGEL